MEVLTGSPDRLFELRKRVTNRFLKLLRRSAERGFLGGMPIQDQVDHALGFVFAVEETLNGPPTSVLDLGTGGGLPGLVLIAAWPQTRTVLLDGNERRTEFLQAEVTASLAGGAEVIRGRAEDLGRSLDLREAFAVVVSRSFGPPSVTAECGSAFVEPGGLLVVSEPPSTVEGGRWPSVGVHQLGLANAEHARFADRFSYQVLRKTDPLSEKYPRRVGVPAKRPLF
jgi:16S rRNA (guanine527-N7)-methyltransferase